MINKPCVICNINIATQKHHKFGQHTSRRKHYGKLIDEEFNIIDVCYHCHVGHRNIPKSLIWNEKTFRDEAVKAGYELPEPMKSYK